MENDTALPEYLTEIEKDFRDFINEAEKFIEKMKK